MQNFHNQFVALYTLYLSSQYLPLTRHSIDWCREIKCYVPSKHQYCQFEKIRICKHWHLKGIFVYNVNSSKCYNHRAADRLHWQQGHHNHIWYLHDAFSPRHVTSRVPLSAVSPGTIVLSAQWCHLVSPRICTLYLYAAQGARLPVCTVQHSVLLLLLLLLIRSSWQKKFAGYDGKANISQVNFEVFRIIKYFADKARADQTQLWCEHIGGRAQSCSDGGGVRCHVSPVGRVSMSPCPH